MRRAACVLLALGACSADPAEPPLPLAPTRADAPPSAPPAPEPAPAPAPAPEFPPAPEPAPAPAPPEFVAAAREVTVHARPSKASPRLGYLRLGARVPRGTELFRGDGCARGFYHVSPDGYVCSSADAEPVERSAEGGRREHGAGSDAAELAARPPDRAAPLPYVYARARHVAPPLYVRLPAPAANAAVRAAAAFTDLPSSPLPALLADGGAVPMPSGRAYPSGTLVTGRALSDSSFALLSIFDQGPRRFGLTTDLLLVPLERLDLVRPSTFHGHFFEPGDTAVAFALRRSAFLYARNEQGGLGISRPLGYREALGLTGKSIPVGRQSYLETASGEYAPKDVLLVVRLPESLPRAAQAGKRWIHVSLRDQTLVAYEGTRPVYATLVSTGLPVAGDSEPSRATVTGDFLIHTKHVSATMDSDEIGDEYDHRDVPYVQYFQDGFAFHAAHWHDAFGSPRSHGCVNLSPEDARWLFHWTDPPVPPLWHGAFSLLGGTLVRIAP